MDNLEDIVDKLINDDADSLSDDDIRFVLTQSMDDLEAAADNAGESLDYIIEAALEQASARANDDLLHVIQDQWLQVEDIPNGTIYEVVVRSAEFLADYHHRNGSSPDTIKNLATSDNWRNRLVAAWYIRTFDGSDLQEEREALMEDPFMDDNGYYLVREGLGENEDDMFS